MEIDHVIPESLDNNREERERLFGDLGLPFDWCLTDDKNLVPSCRPCNLRKLASLPPTNQLIILLTKVAEKAAEVARLRVHYEKEERADFARVRLETALASGLLKEVDVDKALAKAAAGNDLVQLAHGADFLVGLTVENLRPSQVNELLDLAVRLGADLPKGLPFTCDGDSVKRFVRTVREYRAAIAYGCYAYTTFDMKMEAFFKNADGMLTALEACRPSAHSFTRSPRCGLCDIDLLPSSLLAYLGEGDQPKSIIAAYPTIGEVVRANKARVVQVSSFALTIEFEGTGTHMREILRADLDGDGYEDLLVTDYISAVGGTLGAGQKPIALARRSLEEPFSQTKIIPSPAFSE